MDDDNTPIGSTVTLGKYQLLNVLYRKSAMSSPIK